MAGASRESTVQRTLEGGSSVIRQYKDTRYGFLILLLPALLIILLLLVVPAAVLIEMSFRPFVDGRTTGGFTLAQYERALTTSLYGSVIVRTVRMSVLVTLFTFLLGFPLAYAAVRKRGVVGTVIILATLMPLMIDIVIRAFGWFILLGRNGLVATMLIKLGIYGPDSVPELLFSETAMIIGLTHVHLPFMVFPLISVLYTIPRSLEEAARDLGANRLTVFRKILFPMALPGISAGVLITFALTMASYVTPAMLGGDQDVIAEIIERMFTRTQNWAFASAMATILFVIAITLIFGYGYLLKHSDRFGEM